MVTEKTRVCDFKVLYRVENYRTGSLTLTSINPLHTTYNPSLVFEEYFVVKETPHTYLLQESIGNWLEPGDFYDPQEYVFCCPLKRVYKKATNRFAWETKELAMADFARKQRWRKNRLLQELEECETMIKKADLYIAGEEKNNVY